MRPDGTSPKMNSDARAMLNNWLLIARCNEDKQGVFLLERVLKNVEPLETESVLSQDQVDKLLGGAK